MCMAQFMRGARRSKCSGYIVHAMKSAIFRLPGDTLISLEVVVLLTAAGPGWWPLKLSLRNAACTGKIPEYSSVRPVYVHESSSTTIYFV